MNPIAQRAGREASARGFQSQLGPLLFLTAVFFQNFIGRIILAPLMPAIEQDLALTHGQAGSLFLPVALGYFPGLLGSGHISSRCSHRRTILFSAALIGLCLLAVAQCRNLWGLRAALGLMGLAAGLYLPSGIAALTALVRPQDWGKALGVHEMAPNLSFLAAPLIASVFLGVFSWRGIMLLVGGCALLLALAFGLFARGGDFRGEAPGFRSLRILLRRRGFWIMLSLFSLGVSATLGIYAILPLYLVAEKGLGQDWANTLVALSRILTPGVAFLAGWLTDRLGVRRTLMLIFALSGPATAALGVAGGAWLVLAVVLQPLAAVCFFPAGFAALVAVVPPETRNVAVSLTIPLAFIFGGGLIPMLIGIAGDLGSFGTGIALTGALVLGGAIAACGLVLDPSKA